MREIEAGIAEAREVRDAHRALAFEASATLRVLQRSHRALAQIEVPEAAAHIGSYRSAGPAAIETVLAALAGIGRTTQAELTRSTGLNSGTVTHALRWLEHEGRARKTGRRFRGSAEWAAGQATAVEDDVRADVA